MTVTIYNKGSNRYIRGYAGYYLCHFFFDKLFLSADPIDLDDTDSSFQTVVTKITAISPEKIKELQCAIV